MPINQLNSTGRRSNDMICEADNQTFRKIQRFFTFIE